MICECGTEFEPKENKICPKCGYDNAQEKKKPEAWEID